MKKEKLKHYLMGVMILAAVVTELSGCSSPSLRKKQAAEALQQKYGEEFEISAYKSEGLLDDYYTVIAYAAEYPDLPFKASVNTKTGNVSDAYVAKRLCDRISDKISLNLGSLETDYYVYTETMLDGTAVTDAMVTLEDFMKEGPGNRFTVYLFMNREGAAVQNIVSAFGNILNDLTEMSGTVCLYLADEEMLAGVQEYVTSHDNTHSEFDEMTEEAYIGSVSFENGRISLTENNLKEMAGDRL